MEKLTGKGKYTIKIGSYPYTKLVGRIKDKSSKKKKKKNLYLQQAAEGFIYN